MTYNRRVAIKFAAVTLAQNAKTGAVAAAEIDDLVTRAEQELGSADPLTRAIMDFATQHQLVARDADALAREGARLYNTIDLMNQAEAGMEVGPHA